MVRGSRIDCSTNMDYLAREWDNKVLYKFLDDIEKVLQKIKQNPNSYPLHKSSENVRKYKINRRIILYYKVVNDETIEPITFWNTYRNPENLKI
jgi:hypothetical protein